jgi:hypothetical protein
MLRIKTGPAPSALSELSLIVSRLEAGGLRDIHGVEDASLMTTDQL